MYSPGTSIRVSITLLICWRGPNPDGKGPDLPSAIPPIQASLGGIKIRRVPPVFMPRIPSSSPSMAASPLSLHPTVKINGTEVPVPDDWAGYDQANRDEGFFGAIDIPVPFALLNANTDIQVTFADSGGKVSSMVLDVHTIIP